MGHHAFFIEAEAGEGIARARDYAARELGLSHANNPDIIELRYGLLSVEDARKVGDVAMQGGFGPNGKAVIVAANRAYHEAQNALLKVFEEPPKDTFLFLVLPTSGGLLPTLRSRVHTLDQKSGDAKPLLSEAARAFLRGSREKRSTIAKRLATGKDEGERRAHRDEALSIVNGIEAAAYAAPRRNSYGSLFTELSVLREFLYERSAPVRMLLEHLALVIPNDLRVP